MVVGWCLVVGGGWLVVGGWWWLVGGWWVVVVGGWCQLNPSALPRRQREKYRTQESKPEAAGVMHV